MVEGVEYLFQTLKRCSHQLNSKTNGSGLSFEAIFRHWNCFLSYVATDGKDRHGIKVGATFSSFNTMPAKIAFQSFA